MKKTILLLSVFGAVSAFALPQVSNVTVAYASANRVKISYDLTGGPAIVLFDVLTNASAWASIGVDAICGTNSAAPWVKGDAYRRVSGDTRHTIEWNAYKAWGKSGGAFQPGEVKFEVKAFPYANSPDYLVTDLRAGVAAADRVKYYPSEDFLPGGILSNTAYRTTHLVLRRIHARNVRWTMGATTAPYAFFEPKDVTNNYPKAAEKSHRATMPNDYYIGVFEITQAQWTEVTGKNVALYSKSPESPMRPADRVGYARLREAAFDIDELKVPSDTSAYDWPNPPHPDSFLGKLRALVGNAIDFDLPGDAEWEFACRAGLPEGYWNDGTDARDLVNMPGRNSANGGFLPGGTSYPSDSTLGPTNATAVCGSYPPNRWGLFDMHGNIQELCLDWFESGYLGSTYNISTSDPKKAAGGGTGSLRCRRGGSFILKAFDPYAAGDCRASSRTGVSPKAPYVNLGGRVACRAGLR